ncbi:MAG: hypothetical protein COU98_01530 [Candidatus Staskawiczbacteria bacterium CG10_big_fil_rev_8_21_14_0_10_38_10]|uniref:Succinylglutamate desuccinylase/Aspartoacylase catalytic domain-containing protein n=1 Tax=Candidatus Staskawiczbacteria bacterium CG10_big_fil_rev_8_21_14_0_10_38_10 TaxID=1974891 RepID=A0A2H9T1G3_9BACT|nr:MAG: hypothetical protein COU98_01530 [Candidatus Staskawiczbacteria bacterium CG10_big_fil_rev_8_21_14_0_10_38_10]
MFKKLFKRVKNEYKFIEAFSLYDGTKAGFPLMIKKSPKKGPVVFLAGVLHGEEVIGIEVIHRIFENIKLKRGTLYAIPVANMPGLSLATRFLPYGEQSKWENLNRSFPGDENGGPAEKIAATIYKTIVSTKPDLVISLHADSHNSIPYIILDRFISNPDQKLLTITKKLAEAFGITVCNEESLEDYLADDSENTLEGALFNFARIPAFTVELGGPTVVKESFVRVGVAGIKNVLETLDMLDEPWRLFLAKSKIKTNYPLKMLIISGAFHSGKISYKAKLGRKIKKGEIIATVEDIFGKVKEIIKSPADGYLISLGYHILSFPGQVVATLAVKDEKPF